MGPASQAWTEVGKYRGLQQCSTAEGVFAVLAMDHRDNLRRSLCPGSPETVGDEELIAFKREVVAALAPVCSAVLLDPEYGVVPAITDGALPGATGLIVALERTGYSGESTARHSELLPGWDAQAAARVGANAIKLLVYYHPAAPTAPAAEELVRQVGAASLRAGLAFFLETLTYSPDPSQERLSPQEHNRAVLETAARLTPIPGVDVLKAEFPLDIAAVGDETAWLAACRELSAASRVPWVLLSAGVDFDTYLLQVAAAARGGASGVAVGRAVWKEATTVGGAERHRFLYGIARQRMTRVTALCQALARPWYAR